MMGDIAEAMTDGTLCSDCGAYISEGDGFPRSCCACEQADDAERDAAEDRNRAKK